MELKNKPDVIVVGAGGAAVAWRLVEQGLNVLMLEAGERFNPSRDYKLHQADWERHQFPQTQASQCNIGRRVRHIRLFCDNACLWDL